jgi:protein O-GlcNAc transferase
MHKFKSASEEFFKACELNPKNGKWFGDYMYSLKSICLWEKFEQLKSELIARMDEELKKSNESIVHPFSAIMYNFDIDQIFKLSKAMVLAMEEKVVPFKHERPTNPENCQKRKLKIGYVSSNFLNHAQGNQLANYFMNHNRDQFEIYAYNLQIAGSIGAKIQVRMETPHSLLFNVLFLARNN